MIIYDPKITGSFQVNNTTVTSLAEIDTTSGSVASLNAATSSYALKTGISGSFTSLSSSLSTRLTNDESSITSLNTATSSYLQNTTDTLDGDLTVTGTITAQDLHVQEVTSSIVYSSGSNIFGNQLTDTHQFTGSVSITGSSTFSNYGDAHFLNGSVGIGNTSPAAPLDVNGNVYVRETGALYVNTLAGYTSGVITLNNSTNFIIPSGDVGVGTTSPSQKLHVQGGGLFQPGIADGDSIVEIAQTNSNSYVHAGLKINAGGTANPFYIYQSGDSSTLRFNYNSLSDAGGQMVITDGGDVGIGTSSPDALLDLKSATPALRITDTDNNKPYELRVDAETFSIKEVSNSRTLMSMTTGAVITLDSLGSNTVINTSGAMVVPNGSVGIGTNSPSTKLHLGGTAPLDSIIRQDSTVSGTNWEIGERAAGKWQIWEDDGDSVIATFMSTGNVGIGTTSPSEKLDVVEAIRIQAQSGGTNNATLVLTARNGGAYGNSLIARSDIQSTTDGTAYGSDLLFKTTDSSNTRATRMTIDSSGNVGIGTTSPGSKLDIAWGGYQTSGYALTFGADIGNLSSRTNNTTKYGIITGVPYTTTNPNIELFTYYSNSASNALGIGGQGNTDLDGVNSISFLTAPNQTSPGQTRMHINSSGEVGIGTTSNQGKLDVHNAGAASILYVSSDLSNNSTTSIINLGGAVGRSASIQGYRGASSNEHSLVFKTYNSGQYERMRIDSGGIVYIMGATASVNNSLQFQYNSTAGSAEIYSKSTAGNTHFEFYASDSGTTNEVVRFTKEGRITSATDNKALTAIHPRSIAISHGGSSSWTYDLDPVALFGTRVSGGHLHIRANGWQTRLNAGYIVYRNDGGGSSVIGTGSVTYYQTAHSDSGGTDAAIAVSLPSSSTNVIRISFSSWHSNNHGFECVVTTTN